MRRRTFLQQASLAAAASAMAGFTSCRMEDSSLYPVGYQLYSVRDVMATDPLGTVQALLAMGYRHFEAYGYDAESNQLYGFAPLELQRRLADLNTRLTSAHFGFTNYLRAPDDELRRYTDACLQAAQALNLDYLTWPIMPADERNEDGFAQLADRLNFIGTHLQGSGKQLAWHNNGGEFQPLGDGRTGHDIVAAETDASLVKLQLDMYWLRFDNPKLSPSEVVARYPGRIAMWHIKDMHPTSGDYTELGTGTIDYGNLLPSPAASGLQHLYLEQGGNFTHSSMQSAEQSVDYWLDSLAQRLDT